jgi:hypothetical protein
MAATATAGVLKENNRNTLVKRGKAHLFIFLRDKNLKRGG